MSDPSWQKCSPSPRRDHTLTYCPFDNKIYLFGGWNPLEWDYKETFLGDVWTLNSGIARDRTRG